MTKTQILDELVANGVNVTKAVEKKPAAVLKQELEAIVAEKTAEPTTEPAAEPVAPKDPPVTLDDLVTQIIDGINNGDLTVDGAAAYGDNVLKTVGIKGYRAERWDNGRWLSALRTRQILSATKKVEPKVAPAAKKDEKEAVAA